MSAGVSTNPNSIRPEQPLVPSILDRLIDDSPGQQIEAPRNRVQLLREMKISLRRDLENLLNTRRRVIVIPEGLTEVTDSLVTYGIPDFSGMSPVSGKERDTFAKVVEGIIRDNEPRLVRIGVQIQSNAESTDRTLRFRIDAMMLADPAPEPVTFDSLLEPTSKLFQVRGGTS